MTNYKENSSQNVKKILVVGGASFIGSHLCDALLAQGLSVLCLDFLNTAKQKNIESFKNNPRFKIIKESLLSEKEIKDKVDYIVHVAGLDLSYKKDDSALISLLLNSEGLSYLIDKALKDNAEFLFVSLVDIYAGIASRMSLDNYFGENQKEENIAALLEAKRFGEALVQEYRNKKGLKAKIVRIRDVYGPKMNLDGGFFLNQVFNSFVKQKEFTIEGEGVEILYPTYISDLIYGFVKVLFSADTEGKVYYLVNPKKETLSSVAERIASFYEKPGFLKFLPSDKIPLPQPQIDIALSKKDLRWFPDVLLEEGIEKTLVWFKKFGSPKEKVNIKNTITNPIISKEDYHYEKTELIAEDTIAGKDNMTLFEKRKEVGENLGKNFLPRKSLLSRLFGKKSEIIVPVVPKIPSDDNAQNVHRFFKRIKIIFISICAIFLIFGFLSPFLFSGIFVWNGISNLEKAKDSLNSFDLENSQKYSLRAERSFRTSIDSLNNLMWFFSIIHERVRFEQYLYLLGAGKDLSVAASSVTEIVEPISSLGAVFLGQEESSDNINTSINIIRGALVQGIDKFSEAQAKINILDYQYFPKVSLNKINLIKQEIESGKNSLYELDRLLTILPVLMGQNEDRIYLVIFQNNNELRATGGFIGSYAKITVGEGKIKEIKVDDVYNPDGQLQSEEIAPEPLKEHLGVTYWSMRDANWSPDFSIASQDIERFYNEATKEDISGIIAIDLHTIEKLLESLGSIHPLGYDEEINASNFFERAEYYSEIGFTPGSTGKKDFLGACSEELLAKLKALPPYSFAAVLRSLYSSVNERHILFAFEDQILSEMISNYHLGGQIAEANKDFLWIIDSNVGGNKSNYYLDRAFSQNVLIDKEGLLKNTLEITYTHHGESDAWPGGNYRNYLRVYVPKGATLLSSEGFNSEVKTTYDLDKTVFGGYLEVHYDSTQKISLTYLLPSSLAINDQNQDYSLYIEKQSGTVADSFTFSISWPQYLHLENSSGVGEIRNQTYSISTDLRLDRKYNFTFSSNTK